MLEEEKLNNPMNNLEDWDSDLIIRYPEPKDSNNIDNDNKKKEVEYRNYCKNDARAATVQEFYRLNHSFQTYDFVLSKEKEFLQFNRKEMTIWEAIDYLNTLVDDSDPDIELDQTQHLLQTAEACRNDNQPDWFILTGFLHDLGKILCLFGEPQWCVVGDTFPVGCKFSDKIVFPEFFEANADSNNPLYNTKLGVYKENCGLNNVKMSWGHDEYLYQLLKNYLPEPALYMIRYHSFYPQHRHNAYDHLMNEHDHEMFKWVDKFNKYDLYSKIDVRSDSKTLRPYYEQLCEKFLPKALKF